MKFQYTASMAARCDGHPNPADSLLQSRSWCTPPCSPNPKAWRLRAAAAEWDYLQGLFKDDVVLALNEARDMLANLDELNPGTWGPIPEPPPAPP